MKKYKVIRLGVLILMLCSFRWCAAQDEVLSLDNKKLELQNNHFKINQVIDGREDKRIGEVLRGTRLTPYQILLREGVVAELQSLFSQSTAKKGPEVVAHVSRFKVYEQVVKNNSDETSAYCDVQIDFLLPRGDSLFYIKTSSVGTNMKSDLKKTRKLHTKNILFTTSKVLDLLKPEDLQQDLTYVGTQGDDLHITDEMRYGHYPIFTQKLKNGIYRSYKELRDNTPNVEGKLAYKNSEIKKGAFEGSTVISPDLKSLGTKYSTAYAVVVDGQPYIKFGPAYFPISTENYSVEFEAFGRNDNKSKGDYSFLYAFGVVGATAADAASSQQFSQNVYGRKFRYTLNPATGTIIKAELLEE